jgi:hypothetical protein
MRFLIDRCAGTLIADWLRTQGHDVVESRERGPDRNRQGLWRTGFSRTSVTQRLDSHFRNTEGLRGQTTV